MMTAPIWRPDFASQPSDGGFSLVELLVGAVLLTTMLYAVATLSVSGTAAADLAQRMTRTSEVSQEIVDDMRLELVSSVRVFGNDAEGIANLQLLDVSGAPLPQSSAKLPILNSSGIIREDSVGDEISGNLLFFAKLAWTDRFVCSSSNDYLVEVVRWVGYYLTEEGGGPVDGSPLGLNLIRIVSEPLVDGESIDRISDAGDQAEVLLHLLNGTPDAIGVTHARCELVWNRGDLPSDPETIRQIDPGDGTLSLDPISGTGRPDPFRIECTSKGMLYYRHHSVATNYAQENYGVGAFSVESTAGAGFPHGFEVQIAGPSSARQVLLHLVVVSTNHRGHRAWNNVQVVVDTRDM